MMRQRGVVDGSIVQIEEGTSDAIAIITTREKKELILSKTGTKWMF